MSYGIIEHDEWSVENERNYGTRSDRLPLTKQRADSMLKGTTISTCQITNKKWITRALTVGNFSGRLVLGDHRLVGDRQLDFFVVLILVGHGALTKTKVHYSTKEKILRRVREHVAAELNAGIVYRNRNVIEIKVK